MSAFAPQQRTFHNQSFRETATGKPSISKIRSQLRENSLIVDQLATSSITLLTQFSGSRECPVRRHESCKHRRDQLCGFTDRLSALVRQNFGIGQEIAM